MASFAHKVYAQYGRCVNAGAFSSFLIPLVLKETEYLGNSLIISGSLEGGTITIQQYFDAADTGKYRGLRILASYDAKIRPPRHILPDNFTTKASFKNLNVYFLTKWP